MHELQAWGVVAGRVCKYLASRAGLAAAPEFKAILPELMVVFGRVLRWEKRLAVLGADQCPAQGPAVFAANHGALDDPFVMFRAIYLASGENILAQAMMRKGLFTKSALASKVLDFDELMRRFGALQIDRDRVSWSEMRPFVDLLAEGRSFMIYPGRTRTRSGVFFEYRGAFSEPGAVSFFLAQAQRRVSGPPVPAAPLARTYNPVSRRSAIAFGPPLHLSAEGGRGAQRALDYALAEAMGDLVEINAAQLAAALLHNRCLRGPGNVSIAALSAAMNDIVRRVPDRHVDPALRDSPEHELRETLRYFQKRLMIRLRPGEVRPRRDAVLATPPLDKHYRKRNPVKYLANQLLHLPDVTAAIEDAAL